MKSKFMIRIAFAAIILVCSASCNQGTMDPHLQNSPQWNGKEFVNDEPIINNNWGSFKSIFEVDSNATPSHPLPVHKVDTRIFENRPETGLRMTWLGHSSFILEVDGYRFLVDPNWSERSSPVSFAGPKRWYEPLLALDSLPRVDAILFSHNHYDHFDPQVVRALAGRNTLYIVPLGLGKTLLELGVPQERITELDWWESKSIGKLTITATPARHASGRGLFDQGQSLWAGYAFQGETHNVYYSGDTGPFKAAKDIGAKLGPFDLSIVECGQYNKSWPDWHLTPEQTLEIHRTVRGKYLVPVHWGLFTLASHSWKEPVERLIAANLGNRASILVPKPGESFEPALMAQKPIETWWEKVQ